MDFLKSSLFVVIIFGSIESYSQDKMRIQTFAIIDTNKTKIEQAFEIYTWITNNIRYDVKAFLNGDTKTTLPSEILKKRKGVCKDYSLLFNEMCLCADIESYIIDGYSKGGGYFRGGGFYRADHCWNVIHIDSLWYLLDLTWGSGYLIKKPSKKDLIRNLLIKTPYVNKKLVFVKAPTTKYFNMSADSMALTHLPLDPKWQFKNYPYSIESFENDTLKETSNYLDYKSEIMNARNLSETQRAFMEGVNGKKFNKKNDFDIGYGYLSLASEFNDESMKVDTSNIQAFIMNLEHYRKAKSYFSHYKQVSDSVFEHRLTFLGKESKVAKKILSVTKHKLDDEKFSYANKQKELLKRYAGLLKRSERCENQIMKESVRQFGTLKNEKTDRYDSTLLALNLKAFEKSVQKSDRYKREIDSIMISCYSKMNTDSIWSIECLKAKNDFINHGNFLREIIATEDNRIIFSYWNTIKTDFNNMILNYRNKAQNLALIRSQFVKIISNMNLMAAEFHDQIEFIVKIHKYSNDSIDVVPMINPEHDLLIKSYSKVYDFIKGYQMTNEKLIDFNMENYQLSQMVHGFPLRHIKLFMEYDADLYLTQTREYTNEKRIIKLLKSQSNSRFQRLEKKVLAFKSNPKDIHP